MTEDPRPDDHPGGRIVTTSWLATIVFAATAIPSALHITALDRVALWTAIGLFLIAIPIWLYAFVVGVGRSRTDLVTISGLFFLHGSAPVVERRLLMGALAVTLIVTAGTAAAEPAGVMVPVLPLAFAGLWAARHGTFPERPEPPPRAPRHAGVRRTPASGPSSPRSESTSDATPSEVGPPGADPR